MDHSYASAAEFTHISGDLQGSCLTD